MFHKRCFDPANPHFRPAVTRRDVLVRAAHGFGAVALASLLDPPALGNYTNSGSSGSFSSSYAREFSDRSRLRVIVAHDVVNFLVPNELLQQVAGQRHHTRRPQETAEKVARVGLRALAAGKSSVISGFTNWLGAETVRLVPRRMVARIAGGMFRPQEK